MKGGCLNFVSHHIICLLLLCLILESTVEFGGASSLYCSYSEWSSCDSTCEYEGTRKRTCNCYSQFEDLPSGNQRCMEQENRYVDVAKCDTRTDCFYTSSTFIMTVFGVVLMLVGTVVLLFIRFRTQAAQRTSRQSQDVEGGSDNSYRGMHVPYTGESNPAFDPPTYIECVGDSSNDTILHPSELPPAYEEAIAQIKKREAELSYRNDELEPSEKSVDPAAACSSNNELHLPEVTIASSVSTTLVTSDTVLVHDTRNQQDSEPPSDVL